MKNKIHDFKSFMTLNESKNDGVNLIIGDSTTPNISKKSNTLTILGDTGSEGNLWKSGVGVKWLKTAVSKYPVSNKVKNVVIKIGSNGAYSPNDDIKGLMVELRRVFPQAKFFAAQGSWGWGNNINVTTDQVKRYYDRFKNEGVTIVEPPIGKVSDPHKDLPIYKDIAKSIDDLINQTENIKPQETANSQETTKPQETTKTESKESKIISRPGDPYKYKVENDNWLAKKDSQSKWYEISGANYKPAYQSSIDKLDKENPEMRSKNAPNRKN